MKKQKLKKELGLFDVYAIATGVTLSAGFFLLPGLAAVGVGPGLPLAYLLAGFLIVPGLVSMADGRFVDRDTIDAPHDSR